MYLYRNDKQWLFDNLPLVQKHINGIKIVGWNKRDKEYVKRLKALYEDVRGFKKSVRITAALLVGILGIRANLERHLNQLHFNYYGVSRR